MHCIRSADVISRLKIAEFHADLLIADVIKNSICEKHCAISRYFVRWPTFKFCMQCYAANIFHYTKIKKSVTPKTIFSRKQHFCCSKKLQNSFKFCTLLVRFVKNGIREKKLGSPCYFLKYMQNNIREFRRQRNISHQIYRNLTTQ